MGLKQSSNSRRIPAGDCLQDRHEHAQSIVAENRPARDLRDVRVLGYRDRQPFQLIDMEHHVNIRTAVAYIHQTIVADCQFAA